ncbi:MAG: cell envelope integrity protein CreD [Sphingosinicella sp.]|uniref:cell envelope integrity protein CreD n=1 Tax=Sphingosinicella sp. TaxID=1917971 RepID=UPI004037ECF6
MLSQERSPGAKLALALLVGFLLSFPLFTVWLLVYDRQQQSEFARAGIAEGWGGPQIMAGPLLVIPYRATITETVTENNREVSRSRQIWRELTLAPELARLDTDVDSQPLRRSIYEAVVYQSRVSGRARFAMPGDLARLGIAPAELDLARAELRFGLSDPRGLGANPRVSIGGRQLPLQPGGAGAAGGRGFFAPINAGVGAGQPRGVEVAYVFRGHGMRSRAPHAGDTLWRVRANWPHPSFQGGFLPAARSVRADGFTAEYRVGNLALGRSLVSAGAPGESVPAVEAETPDTYDSRGAAPGGGGQIARISLIQPVDLYSRVNRATKYGFLFIGFTFLAFLMFDVIGGVRVSAVEYLLVGAGLVLFFVLLLAFAEVIGFAAAYLVAAAAIAGLNTAYSAAVLKSWRRAGFIGALLTGLYAVLYVLLSLEAYSLLIGALMLFVALAVVMYVTRNLNWGARGESEEAGGTSPAA